MTTPPAPPRTTEQPGAVKADCSDAPILVRLPEQEILKILVSSISEQQSLTKTMFFNVDHGQWDFILKHAGAMVKLNAVIVACAEAFITTAPGSTVRPAQSLPSERADEING